MPTAERHHAMLCELPSRHWINWWKSLWTHSLLDSHSLSGTTDSLWRGTVYSYKFFESHISVWLWMWNLDLGKWIQHLSFTLKKKGVPGGPAAARKKIVGCPIPCLVSVSAISQGFFTHRSRPGRLPVNERRGMWLVSGLYWILERF